MAINSRRIELITAASEIIGYKSGLALAAQSQESPDFFLSGRGFSFCVREYAVVLDMK